MKFNLLRLSLKNFKGVREFTFQPDGLNAVISGPNGSGKSTIADGINWLLFNKNQAGDSAFSVKPLDENGLEIHNLEHSVEAVLGIDDRMDGSTFANLGRMVTLRKVMTEKWTKKRGSSTAEFTGHETTYYIDDVPKKESEFKAFISGIIFDESTFRMLTSITHFNTMKWQDRRKALFDVVGDITDADVIATDGRFAELPGIIENRTFEDTVKMLKSWRPKLNDEISHIGPRIDEALRLKPAESSCIPPQTGTSYSDLSAKLQSLQYSRAAVLAGDTSEIQQQITAKESEISQKASAHRGAVMDAEDARRKLRQEISSIGSKITELALAVKAIRNESEKLAEANAAGRAAYIELRDRKAADRTCCPTCEQDLPTDNSKAAELRKKIEASLDQAIADNIATGKGNKAKITQNEHEIENALAEIVRLQHVIDSKQAEIDAIKDPDGPNMIDLQAELSALRLKLTANSGPDTAKVDKEIEVVRETIKLHDEATANNKRAGEVEARVTELKADQKRLGKELDELDRKLDICNEFTRAKVSMLESGVAAKFAPLSFKLFSEQINGGLAECCETLVPSPTGSMVPWSDANTGARILAGLKIIDVLSGYYGISAPVFVDNAESLTVPRTPMDSQVIMLIASSEHEGLAVKVETAEEATA